jgi:F-type H+-transporting ATPase subunit b
MPQFDFASVFIPQLAWLAVFFIVLYFGVVRLTLPKLSKVMGEREDKIAGDLTAAKAAKDSSDAVSEAYHSALDASREAARAAIAEAKAKAVKTSETRLAKAAAAADEQIAAAEARIAGAVAEAEAALRDVAAEGAQAIVARLTGKEPALAASRKAVDARLAG